MLFDNAPTTRRCFCCGEPTDLTIDHAVRLGWSFNPVRDIAACPRHSITTHNINVARTAHRHGMTAEQFYQRALPRGCEEPRPAGGFVLAVTHHGQKLRDTSIGIATFGTLQAAVDSLRAEFANELGPEAGAMPEAELLDTLRWQHNVIAEIAPMTIDAAP